MGLLLMDLRHPLMQYLMRIQSSDLGVHYLLVLAEKMMTAAGADYRLNEPHLSSAVLSYPLPYNNSFFFIHFIV